MKHNTKEVAIQCPRCKKSNTFKNGSPTDTTDGVTLVPYWCQDCNMAFHIHAGKGKKVEVDEF